jgi:DNA helicase HerA-like ATPase
MQQNEVLSQLISHLHFVKDRKEVYITPEINIVEAMVLHVYGGNSSSVFAAPSGAARLGELFVYKDKDATVLLKVIGFEYVSTIQEQFLAEMSREGVQAQPLRLTYAGSPTTLVVTLKPLGEHDGKSVRTFRGTIGPGSQLVEATSADLAFLERSSGLYFGDVRSGDKRLDTRVRMDAVRTVSEHILIAATTGRGKSNLLKTLLWSLLDSPGLGLVVIDPHREYYRVLKDHENADEKLISFSPNPTPGESYLAVSTRLIRPVHLTGALSLSEAQEREAELLARRHSGSADGGNGKGYGEDWIEALFDGRAFAELEESNKQSDKAAATSRYTLSRKLSRLLSIDTDESYGVFRLPRTVRKGDLDGSDFLRQVCAAVDAKKVVVVDTSNLSQDAELLLGNLLAYTLLERRMRSKQLGGDICPAALVLEEAPRVLSRDSPQNAYMKIAREGRKFGLGLIAVTQLISVMPDDILANLNTKVYLGMASGKERRAAIDNALNDMTGEEDELLKLDIGEAILTSSGLGFAIPIKVPLIDELRSASKSDFHFVAPGEKLEE